MKSLNGPAFDATIYYVTAFYYVATHPSVCGQGKGVDMPESYRTHGPTGISAFHPGVSRVPQAGTGS